MFAQTQGKLDFDKCAFPNCNNGKHNNFTLFGIPKKICRQKLWLNTIDNPSLMKYSTSYVRKAGICKNHFTADSFVDPGRKILRRFANPVNLKHIYHARLLNSTTEDNTTKCLSSEILNVDNHSNINHFSSDANVIDLTINEASPKVSPVKKISAINENGSLKDNTNKDFKRGEDNMYLIVNKPHRVYMNNCKSRNNCKNLVSKKIQTEKPPHSITVDEVSNGKLKQEIAALKRENIRFRIELIKFEQTKKQKVELSQKVSNLNNLTKRQADRITKLNEKISSLQDNLILDNYLNFYNGLTSVAKTMIKLQLHKPKAPYSEEQKALAISIFFQSSGGYSRLCEAGINLPSISSVKNWISESGIMLQ